MKSGPGFGLEATLVPLCGGGGGAMITGIAAVRRVADGSLVPHAELTGGLLNDMLVDSHGCAYVGNFGFDLMSGGPPRTANLVLVRPTARPEWPPRSWPSPTG